MEGRMLVTPPQLRAARALLGWSQEQMAQAAGVGLSTIRDYENERRAGAMDSLKAICRALENQGVVFLPSRDDYGPGVCLLAKVPNVLRWPVKLGTWSELLIPVEWPGREYAVLVAHEVLDDLGGFRESKPSAEYVRVFEEHRADILRAAASAIDAGRVTPDMRVSLDTIDFIKMRKGDHVDVTVVGRKVGPGRIVDASVDPVRVIVERPRRGPYQFDASRTFFRAVAPGRWRIDMPSPTMRELLPPET